MAAHSATGRTDPINLSDRFTSTDQTGRIDRLDRFPGHATSNQQIVSTSTQPNSSIDIAKFLAECKNDLAKMIKENLGVDVRGKT